MTQPLARRRRRAAALCALGATHAARYCPVASNGTSARDRCVGRELELQIWNDAGRAVVVHRVDARGREHTGIFLAPGAVVRRLGCEGTLWRARRTEGLPSRGRVIAERYQGAETGDDAVEALVASVSDRALDAKHGDAGGERWRVGACDALPQTATYFSSYRERGAAFELEVVRGNCESRARENATEPLAGPEIFADVTIDLLESFRWPAGGRRCPRRRRRRARWPRAPRRRRKAGRGPGRATARRTTRESSPAPRRGPAAAAGRARRRRRRPRAGARCRARAWPPSAPSAPRRFRRPETARSFL